MSAPRLEAPNPARLSVIVTCWNSGALLTGALESLRRQTRPPDETLVVDGGSTDPESLRVLEQAEADGLRVLRLHDGGLAAARNAGVQASRGEWIAFLDADNRLGPGYLAAVAGRLELEPGLDFVSTGMRAFGAASFEWVPPTPDPVTALVRGAPHQSTLFRRAVHARASGFDPRFHVLADHDFWVSALASGCRGEVLPEPLLEYCVRPGSLYHGALERGTLWPEMRELLRKHSSLVQSGGVPVLLATQAHARQQAEHRAALLRERDGLRRERLSVESQLRSARSALASQRAEPVDWGSLRRLTPVSPVWGLERGGPLDRYYIESFLDRFQQDVRGDVLEVKDSGYTTRFGRGRVSKADVLDLDSTNPGATIHADLTRPDALPANRFDCFVLTQTLHILFDVRTALRNAVATIRPGGTLLCTLPAVSRVNYEDGGVGSGDFWRFTQASCRALFEEWLPPASVEVVVYGNLLACTAFLQGLSWRELTVDELDHVDPYFPLLFGVRARKPEA